MTPDTYLKFLMILNILSSFIVGMLICTTNPEFTYPLALVFSSSFAVIMIAYGRLFKGYR